MATSSDYECCRLAQERSDKNLICLKKLMLQNVWKYFSAYRSQEKAVEEKKDNMSELLSFILGATVSGCTVSIDCIIHSAMRIYASEISMKEIINARLPCDFPIPDSWIHKTLCLAISPLHMACWRLDVVMIQKLLSLGADPNSLAWEKFEADCDKDKESCGENASPCSEFERRKEMKGWISLEGIRFDPTLGFSPLHFIALGLRSPPSNSLAKGKNLRIIHDICVSYETSNLKSIKEELYKSARLCYPVHTLEEMDTKCEMIEYCIQLLLLAGANPNMGNTHYLNFYFPLDLAMQPPLKIYYSSIMARSTQRPESLSRQDFELNLIYIMTAARTLVTEGAKLSPKFLSTHSWGLQLLDCFFTCRPNAVASFVELLILLGLFPDNGHVIGKPDENESSRCLQNICTEKDILKFIVGAIHISPPKILLDLILKWCSMAVLHRIIEISKTILSKSEFSLTYLYELVDIAMNEQLHTLKHLCKLVILKNIGFNVRNLDLLPLPPPLLRDIKTLRNDTGDSDFLKLS